MKCFASDASDIFRRTTVCMRERKRRGHVADGAALRTPWWNSAAARNTTTRPLAVLFFHIGKTGGGSIMQYLTRHNPRFNLKLDYTRSRLFISLHQDLFARWDLFQEWALGGKPVGARPSWESTAAVVEFHSATQSVFWQEVAPALPELRARYSAAGGRLLTLTTVRDPVPMIVSWYRQWPPRHKGNKSVIEPFSPWLANASGLLTRALAHVRGPARIWHSTRVPHFGCPSESVALARSRLVGGTFDIVGDVADVGWALRSLVHCLGWPASALPPVAPHVGYGGAFAAVTQHETDHARSGHTRAKDSVRCRLERAARCDRSLYEAASGGLSRCSAAPSLAPRAAVAPAAGRVADPVDSESTSGRRRLAAVTATRVDGCSP